MQAPRTRDAAVARPPEPPPEPPPGPYYDADGRSAREAPAATVARLPGPYYAVEGREARETAAATVARPPELRPGPNYQADVRATREAAVATVTRSPEARPEPEPRPGPYYVAAGRTTHEASVATMARPQEPWPGGEYYPAERPVRRRSSSSALASCLVATAFLLLAAGGAGAALFLLYRPRPPDIAVAAVRLPSFAAANGTVAFTFEQMATVRNPNRSPLAHFDSSLRVAYAGGELGSVYIPAGLIDGGRSKDMSASFAVPAFAAATPPPQEIVASAAQQQPAAAAVMEVDSLLVVKGKVTVLRVLTHRVKASKVCRVGVSPVDGKVLGLRC